MDFLEQVLQEQRLYNAKVRTRFYLDGWDITVSDDHGEIVSITKFQGSLCKAFSKLDDLCEEWLDENDV